MTESEDAAAELLFFDTFSHEEVEDINLDLVQFPKPVYITQVRIIPLGARVQADFPGGVRLGATNPSKFGIEFFVNDLGMPGASTFENLGHLQYNQNDCIHLECAIEKIPTDGLVLRGWYSTITLAVYGILTNSMTEPIASPPPPPCEPAAPEEILNLSTAVDGRNSVIPDDVLKEEWKEPLPGEVPHVHKTTVANDFEREDLDYGLATTREHYSHHTHSGDERERRMRKASHSSERSASSRNRTHSESNERDYMREREREKGGRDWSRSPEYTRHGRRKRSERSRSDAEEPHKWPRTPPSTSIDSPTRPRSPDNLDYADEDSHYGKIKSRSYTRGNDDSQGDTPTDSHTPLDDDDTPGTPGEQFEPILSDDEIIGDDDSSVAAADEFEMELDALAAAAEPAIVALDPYKMPIEKFTVDLQSHYTDEWESLRLLFKKFDLQTKCSSVAAFKAAATTVDERENFVFLSEQLINQLAYLSQQYKRRQFVVQRFFQNEAKHLPQAVGILKIALDFEAACLQTQPAFKIRHIKIGARLTELLGSSVEFMEHLLNVEHFDIYAALFALYQQDYMALSIKLMLLKAVYALLDTKAGVRSFLGGKMNGYQLILETLQQTQLTRTKYALKAILKKLNLSEALECIRENCTNLFILANWKPSSLSEPNEPYQLIEHAMAQVLDALSPNALSYQQPRRFLPVSKKFELVSDASAQRSFANALQAYFTQHSLAESLLLLLSNANELPMTLLMRSLDLLKSLLNSHVGVDYLVDDCFETTQMLVAVLLNLEELPEAIVDSPEEVVIAKIPKDAELEVKKEVEEKTNEMNKALEAKPKSSITEDSTELEKPLLLQHRLQRLGIELAYKVQTRYHLDAIIYTASKHEYDPIKLATHLHALCSQTCCTPGRHYTVSFICLNNNIQIFMDLIKKEQRLQSQRQLASSPIAKYKSPVLSYAVDLVDCCVRYNDNLEYLIEHGGNILELAKNHESLEPSVSAVLQEMFVYLKPLEAINIFSYEDITPLVEVITRSLEYLTTFPGDLIMGLRILKHLAIGSGRRLENDEMQLKHRFVALQFYAADGVQTLIQIIEKLCSYFEQPGLHSPALMSIQGIHCCQMMLPTLQVLRELLSFAIQCRDVEFRDLTAIDHLMKAYCLMHYFPAASQAASEVRQAKSEIIQILLAYTQPNELDEESLHKSLWTQMIREILKNINGPSTFIPGLQVLAELLPLPLPLPLPSTVRLQESQMKRLITERKLWSAHLHPQSSQIAKLIETIAPSSFPQLSDLMVRICLQLADLAPNMTLLISKTLSDLLCNEFVTSLNVPTQQLVRLLSFFARLTAHASLKSSALSILNGKLWELFQAVLTISQPSEIGFKCQLSIHRILESFLDSEISLISPQSSCTPELNLASALPLKELIPRIVEAIVTNLMNVDVTHEISALGVRNLVILTEHDITFYHLSLLLKQRSSDFQQWLNKIIAHNESGSYNSNIESLVLLLRSLTQIEENTQQETTIPLRTLKLTSAELSTIMGFQKDVKPHLLERIRKIFENKQNSTGTLLSDINNLITQLEAVDGSISMDTDESSSPPEPLLPQTEGIVTQYAARPIFAVQTTLDYTQLSASQWLDTLRIDSITAAQFEADYERVPCDLTELANVCLSQETNLTSDCKRLLHLSASPQSNRERTPTAPCFRTRRVEVEPSTGRPEKKIYITPVRGRGYSRPPPSRGDLFRSRPPNTSRPPSLHVDDFLALETCGAQPTGPTGYNKIPPLMRGSRVGRNRGSRISSSSAYSTFSSFRKSKLIRTSSPSTWNDGGSGSPHYRTATSEPHFGGSGGGGDSHYSSSTSHFVGRPRGRGGRMRSFLR